MDYINLYVSFLKRFLNPKRKIKVVLDCSNGTTGLVLEKLLKTNPLIDRELINQKVNGNFPAHGPDPLKPSATRELIAEVKKRKANLGVIFDADGDRALFIDDKGNLLHPDAITNLIILYLKPRIIVLAANVGWLVKKIRNADLKVIESKVGHYFIKEMMREAGADFGAEPSGHYYFKDFFYSESGILAAIYVINAISQLPYKLSDFSELLPRYYRSEEINFKIKNPEGLFKTVEKKYRKVSHLDGLTAEFENWWFNLRPSNTESLVRLNVEAESKKVLKQKTVELKKIIDRFS